jgi:NADP-dependent 3-hydroxy acid dehydrogenase YdfG
MSERIAIVTGAARGIGAGTAVRLAADGMAVAVVDLNEADCAATVKEIENNGGRALAVAADVSKSDQVQAAVDRIAAELGEPTVLVNNAGITRDAMLFKMTDEQWDTVINVNLRGPFLMTRAVQKYMTGQKWGRVVNISSSSALGNRGQANYSATKAGMEGFTKTLAKERGRAALHRHRHDREHGRQPEDVVRGSRGNLQEADSRRTGRPAGRRGTRYLLPGKRGRGLRLRPGHLRSGRPSVLTHDSFVPCAAQARMGLVQRDLSP